jgi:1-acyl-sn-glycerol-3-phosphate acyltransferase
MDQNHLFKKSTGYNVLRNYARFVHNAYYEEICIVGAENIPEDEPVIFAPNHQNALMDALAILLYLKQQPVFMARADIFKQPTTKKILTFLKIIPVFRIRDGIESLSNNDESFLTALKVLKAYEPVGIMPEGNHGEQRRLRPLKKGLMRFAFMAQEDFGKKANVQIIPVGLEYKHYSRFRSKLLIIFGQPINVAGYMQAYGENQQKTLMDLREHLADAMTKNMLNIDNTEYYDTIWNVKELFGQEYQQKMNFENDYYGLFKAEKLIADKLTHIANSQPEVLHSLKAEVLEYNLGLKRLNISDQAFKSDEPKIKDLAFDLLRYILFLPFFAIAVAFNAIPFFGVSSFAKKKIKDPQFVSSVKYVLLLIAFPLYYLLFLLMPIPLLLKICMVLTMPILGLLSVDYYWAVLDLFKKIRFWSLEKGSSTELFRLKTLRKNIANQLETLIQ